MMTIRTITDFHKHYPLTKVGLGTPTVSIMLSPQICTLDRNNVFLHCFLHHDEQHHTALHPPVCLLYHHKRRVGEAARSWRWFHQCEDKLQLITCKQWWPDSGGSCHRVSLSIWWIIISNWSSKCHFTFNSSQSNSPSVCSQHNSLNEIQQVSFSCPNMKKN